MAPEADKSKTGRQGSSRIKRPGPSRPSQPTRGRNLARVVLPASIALVSGWFLIGCGLGVYIPTGEHAQQNKMDFRSLVGDAKSKRPIRPLGVTRSKVLALLGSPDYRADDGRTVGYVLRTYKGYYYAPLCFQGMGAGHWYRLRLRFGADEILEDYTLSVRADVFAEDNPPVAFPTTTSPAPPDGKK